MLASLIQARRRQAREPDAKGGLQGLGGLRMLARSGLFVKLTACVMLTGICMEGMYELLGQYFQLKLGYTVQDQVRHFIVPLHTTAGTCDCHAAQPGRACAGPDAVRAAAGPAATDSGCNSCSDCIAQSHMLITAGAAGLLVNTLMLRWLLARLGEKNTLCIGARCCHALLHYC